MFCSKCGREIEKGAAFCKYCGARVEQGAGRPSSLDPLEQSVHMDKAGAKGTGGKILCVAGVVAALGVAVALAVFLVMFAKDRISEMNLGEKLLAEDEDGRILGGKMKKSDLPAFIRELLGEDEEEEEEPEESEEDTDSQALAEEEDPELLFEKALEELVSLNGVFNGDQRGVMYSNTDRWMNPAGVISATILDFDQDGEQEMMVYHMEPSADEPGSFNMMLSMYEIREGEAVLADKVPADCYEEERFGLYRLSENLWSEINLRVNLVRQDGRCLIFTESTSAAAAFADGWSENYWLMEYEDDKWNYVASFTQTAGGSDGFAYTGYEFEKGNLVSAQVYYDQYSSWNGGESLYGDFNTAIREFFARFGVPLRSDLKQYGENSESILSSENDKTPVFTFKNELEDKSYRSRAYPYHATMVVEASSVVPGEPVPAYASSAPQETAPSVNSDYILPDSNSRYLTREEVSRLSKGELRLARNEIYARHGRLFNSADLQNYFNGKSWYLGRIPANQFSDSVFNDYEKKNVILIQEVEDKKP